MYRTPTHVSPQNNFTLSITFKDGVIGILDMKPYLNFGVFARLKDENEFQLVRVVFDSIEWNCGVDLDPEFVDANCNFAVTEAMS